MSKTITEEFLRDVADRHGLQVDKRITTGTDRCHFATFDLSGPAEQVRAAWSEVKPRACPDFASLTHVSNKEHPRYGEPYIECQSVWCDRRLSPPEEKTGASPAGLFNDF